MKIKTLLCNCKGLSDSFKKMDINTLPFEIESELDVDYTIVHPQLCGQSGNEILEDVLCSAEDDPDTYVIVGACSPKAQMKLFKKVLRSTGFDEEQFIPVDIRETKNQGILERLQQKVQALVNTKRKQH